MLRIVSYILLAGSAAYASEPAQAAPKASKSGQVLSLDREDQAYTRAEKPSPTETTIRELVLPAGTTIHARIDQSLSTQHDRAGAPFVATVSAPVVHNGRVILPRGAVCRGHIRESKPSGRLKGRARMGLSLDTVQLRGNVYRVSASGPVYVSKNHKKHDAVWIGGGAGTGATIGAIAGGGVGAAIGAGAGAVAGTAGAVITGKKQVRVAAETPMVFTLRRAVWFREADLRASR